MMKRILLLTLLCAFIVAPLRAVLNEKDLPQTLSVLRTELETNYNEQKLSMQRLQMMNEQQHEKLRKLIQRSGQICLMLYSQKPDYTFDITYACHEATEQYRDFTVDRLPYDKIVRRIDSEIERYNGLIKTLQRLPPSLVKMKITKEMRRRMAEMRKHGQPFMLSKQGQADRKACLKYATVLRDNLVKMRKTLSDDQEHYEIIGKQGGERLCQQPLQGNTPEHIRQWRRLLFHHSFTFSPLLQACHSGHQRQIRHQGPPQSEERLARNGCTLVHVLRAVLSCRGLAAQLLRS